MAKVSLGHIIITNYNIIDIQYCFVDKCTLCDIRQKIMLFTLENKLPVWDINYFSITVHVDIVVENPYFSTWLFSDHLYTSKSSMTLFKFNITGNKHTTALKYLLSLKYMNLKASKFHKVIINMIVRKGDKNWRSEAFRKHLPINNYVKYTHSNQQNE